MHDYFGIVMPNARSATDTTVVLAIILDCLGSVGKFDEFDDRILVLAL
jgi:hypothetical protein